MIGRPPYTQARCRMGTLVEIRLWEESQEKAQAACLAAFAEMRRLEDSFSRFDPSSEIRRLAREAHRHPVEVSPDLLDVLSLAQGIAEASRGALDVTAGPWMEMWAAAEQAGRLPSRVEWESARARVGWEKLRLDPARRAVRLDASGMALDLGAVGKGYAVDRAVETLQEAGVRAGMVDAGGNFKIFGFIPAQAGSLQAAGIEDPRQPDRLWGTVDLIHPSVSSSSNALRGFSIAGRRYGHLLDPRTGCPLQTQGGATVLAESAAVADALSTALLVLGPPGMHLLSPHGAEALLIVDAECPAGKGEGCWVSHRLRGHIEKIQTREALSQDGRTFL